MHDMCRQIYNKSLKCKVTIIFGAFIDKEIIPPFATYREATLSLLKQEL